MLTTKEHGASAEPPSAGLRTSYPPSAEEAPGEADPGNSKRTIQPVRSNGAALAAWRAEAVRPVLPPKRFESIEGRGSMRRPVVIASEGAPTGD